MTPERGLVGGTVVVPTIGASPCLGEALEALRRQQGAELQLVCVGPGDVLARDEVRRADRLVEVPPGTGFAAATNRGLAAAGDGSRWVGVLNDDALPEPDWWRSLVEAGESADDVGAVQGLNLDAGGERIDGAGIRWNRWWQAVQIGRGEPAGSPGIAPGPLPGVSATGAAFRRRALAAVTGPEGAPFDEVLESWYEDVDLAARLRAAGFRARRAPRGRLRHVGTASGAGLGERRWELLCGNRWLVLARHLGRGFPSQVPRILLRDLLDLAAARRDGDDVRRAGIRAGLRRARALLPRYRHRGDPTLRARHRRGEP